MKHKQKFIIALVFALLAFAAANVWAAADQGSVPNLVATAVSIKPESPYPGQKAVVTIKYENQGDTEITASVRYTIEIKATANLTSANVSTLVTGTHEVKNLKKKGEAGSTGEMTDTFYAPTKEDTYFLHVAFNDKSWAQPIPFVVETALPPELARLFAGLGIFAAVMAIMAVGTEVVLESIKPLLGLKQKVSAMEALDQLKRELPGQLTGLSVDIEQIKKVQTLFNSLETTLKPVQVINTAMDDIRRGLFGDAITQIEKMGNLPPADLAKWKENVISAIEKCFAKLRDILPLSDAIVNPIKKQVIDKIQSVTVDDLKPTANKVPELRDAVIKPLQNALADPSLAKSWLDSQVDTVIAGGKDKVVKLLDESLIKTLRELGFPDEQTKVLKGAINEKLDIAERFALHQMNAYTDSVRNLLLAVEKRRQEMQSPARKMWRQLREIEELTLGATIVALVIFGAGVVIALLPNYPDGRWRWLVIGIGLAMGLIVAAIVQRVISQNIVQGLSRSRKVVQWASKSANPLLRIEKGFNKMRGETQPAENYGEIPEDVKSRIQAMVPTSVAQVLLQQEDQHQDEESSRLRLLRVFSMIIGVVMAYWLKVDAAEYLNYAIPGIQGQINGAVNFAALHERWMWIPEGLTVGIILTGLAASAGSKFWRDLLGRLQAAREQAEEAARLVRQVKGMVKLEQQEPQ